MSIVIFVISFISANLLPFDYSNIVTFENTKYVFINSIVHAHCEPLFTIRYTLDGSHPSENGILYTEDGINVQKENVEEDCFTVTYQIGIGELYYFPKTYVKEYKVAPRIKLYPELKSNYPIKIASEDTNNEMIIFHKVSVDGNDINKKIVDGDINTKQAFDPSKISFHTIEFSEPNSISFSKMYLSQSGIDQINITVDDTHRYICDFDSVANINGCNTYEIDFTEKVSIKSNLKIEVSSSNNHYSVNDIWFDYYLIREAL